jgi:hydrogenase maturation protease
MSGSERQKRILVLGLGNDLLRDDGVGLKAARRIAEIAAGRADHAEACVATLDLLHVMSGYERVIVVDAYVDRAVPPGTPLRVTPQELPPSFGYRSPHTMPFREMLELGAQLGLPMPREVVIHGLNVEDAWTIGQEFTPAVEKAWPAWAEDVARQEFGL